MSSKNSEILIFYVLKVCLFAVIKACTIKADTALKDFSNPFSIFCQSQKF